eukprot:353872-Chlamydomonas_euryale.AAC.15
MARASSMRQRWLPPWVAHQCERVRADGRIGGRLLTRFLNEHAREFHMTAARGKRERCAVVRVHVRAGGEQAAHDRHVPQAAREPQRSVPAVVHVRGRGRRWSVAPKRGPAIGQSRAKRRRAASCLGQHAPCGPAATLQEAHARHGQCRRRIACRVRLSRAWRCRRAAGCCQLWRRHRHRGCWLRRRRRPG